MNKTELLAALIEDLDAVMAAIKLGHFETGNEQFACMMIDSLCNEIAEFNEALDENEKSLSPEHENLLQRVLKLEHILTMKRATSFDEMEAVLKGEKQ